MLTGSFTQTQRFVSITFQGCKPLEEVREWITYCTLHAKHGADFHAWAVVCKTDNQFIGQVALGAYANRWTRFKDNPNPRYNDIEVELSYGFGKQYWSKGYATEA